MNNSLYSVLDIYGFKPPFSIRQIETKSVWQINDGYILKKSNEEEKSIEKILMINKLLGEENIPAAEYIRTVSGEYYAAFDNNIYSLTRKMQGEHIKYDSPFENDYKSTARNIGFELARLHKALIKIGRTVVYESDLIGELETQLSDIKSKNIDIPCEIITLCREFGDSYRQLPKQLIHRDMQFGNVLLENGRLTCFLDFDSSQINARLFDIVYFGQSVLFMNDYKSSEFITRWVEFFGSFLDGYNSENKLYENEINAMYELCIAMQIGFISYYSYLEEKRELIPNRVDMAKWIYSNKQIFINPTIKLFFS